MAGRRGAHTGVHRKGAIRGAVRDCHGVAHPALHLGARSDPHPRDGFTRARGPGRVRKRGVAPGEHAHRARRQPRSQARRAGDFDDRHKQGRGYQPRVGFGASRAAGRGGARRRRHRSRVQRREGDRGGPHRGAARRRIG